MKQNPKQKGAGDRRTPENRYTNNIVYSPYTIGLSTTDVRLSKILTEYDSRKGPCNHFLL